MKITATPALAKKKYYAPAALGNGALSILIGPEGDQRSGEYSGMTPGIRRAGFRYDNQNGELVPFGTFRFAGKDAATEWRQTLNPQTGILETESVYADGSHIESEQFCHFDRDILAIRIRRTKDAAPFRFEYELATHRMTWNCPEDGVIQYEIDGIKPFSGTIRLTSDVPAKFSHNGTLCTLETDAPEFTVFLAFDERNTDSFEALKADSIGKWDAYHGESMMRVPSPKIQALYDMCQYHLKISSTKWSIPTGIYDTHWHGRYFGFDEYFMFMGLATSGHLSTAGKIPHFRYTLLPKAKSRLNPPRLDTGAVRYAWESDESGNECSPEGFWYEHVFQAGHFALSAWEMYRFSGDRTLLEKELYPVMRGVAEWVRIFKIVRGTDGSAIVGVCTDLERLGPAHENPFMTSCSLIAMFESVSEAAELLRSDSEKVPLWKKIASDLRKNLPQANGRYVPYSGCSERSIGVLAGLYPYGVLPKTDPLERASLEDYSRERFSCGNMYEFVPVGVCSWYACWEALAYARIGDGERAVACLEKLAEETGCFSEMFEIYSAAMRPWFTTAEGIFVQAVNELLLQFSGDDAVVAPARPAAWNDFAFRLQNYGGTKIEVEYKNGSCIRKEIVS